jgi:hypothetical protein
LITGLPSSVRPETESPGTVWRNVREFGASGDGNSNIEQRFYQVLDVNGNPIDVAGLTIVESITQTADTCPNGQLTDDGRWTTDSNGIMTTPDYLWLCVPSGASCYITYSQYFTVNSYPVQVTTGLLSGNTGSHNVIQFTANGGNANCPVVSVSP